MWTLQLEDDTPLETDEGKTVMKTGFSDSVRRVSYLALSQAVWARQVRVGPALQDYSLLTLMKHVL